MRRRPVLLGAVAVAAALALAACSGSSGGGSDGDGAAPSQAQQKTQLAAMAEQTVVPAYEGLGTAVDELATATSQLCAEPSEANLDAARDAWKDAVLAWQGTLAFGVGPAMDARLMADIAFAARVHNIEDLLAGSDPVDVEAIGERGAAVRGLYALEVALFDDGSDALATADGARRCTYAASVATLIRQAVDPVVAEWTEGSAAEDFAAGLEGAPSSTVDELVNDGTQRLEELEHALREQAEASSVEDLDDEELDGPGGYALAGRRAMAESVVALMGDEDAGLIAIVDDYSPELAGKVADATKALDEAAAKLPDSVAEGFRDQDAIEAAADAAGDLKVLLSTEVASQLGVTMTFSDSDGDS